MVDSSLEALAKSAQGGGKRQMERLLTELRPLVCRWALVWTGSTDASEDIAQDVLIRVHDSIPRYSFPAKVTTWVYRITRNLLVDWERKRGTEQRLRDRLKLRFLVQRVTKQEHIEASGGALLQRLMSDLSPRQRAVLDLVDLQGFEPQEVAQMLELAPETVRVHLHRARHALRLQRGQITVPTPEAEEAY